MEATNKEVKQACENAEDKIIIEEKRKIGGLRKNEADKKVRCILYLALGSLGKRVFSQKHLIVKVLSISFEEILDFLDAVFNKPANIKFERYKLLSRKQKDRESCN